MNGPKAVHRLLTEKRDNFENVMSEMRDFGRKCGTVPLKSAQFDSLTLTQFLRISRLTKLSVVQTPTVLHKALIRISPVKFQYVFK